MITDAGLYIPVPAARQRILMAALLVRANRIVPTAELAEIVWDGAPPRSAAVTLRSYVMRLRHVVGPEVAARIVTREPGYLCHVAKDELDAAQFESLCDAASVSRRERDWASASSSASAALALWRGMPLLDVPSESLRQECTPRLEQSRLQAFEDRIEADLWLCRHDRLVPELRELTTAHPLREGFRAQLMLALARGGRHAEALDVYQDTRRTLVAELGIEPGPELRELQQRILAGDADLLAPPSDSVVGASRSVPRQLPVTVGHFTGRVDELTTLSNLSAHGGQVAVICAVVGTAGVGKTALTLRWAHQVAGRFPDGQLYVNLRGYDEAQPMSPYEALAGFLRALGIPGSAIPGSVDERAAAYRTVLAGRRMLIVLDNARDVAQVRPLLPGGPSCMTVVTSRDALAGLVARDGAVRLDVDLLPMPEAIGLLGELIGDPAVADPTAVQTLAGQCCGLPLALRVAAELATARPDVPLRVLTKELADQRHRLEMLSAGGDESTAVRAVFSWSGRQLEQATAHAFWLAGWHPGLDFDVPAIAALTGTGLIQARRSVDQLVRRYLLHHVGPDRYGMHDLLRAYARESVATATDRRHAALARLSGYYLRATYTATAVLFQGCYPPNSDEQEYSGLVPELDSEPTARAWLDAERSNLIAIVRLMWNERPSHVTRLASALLPYLESGGHTTDAITIYGCALDAARYSGDRIEEAAALINLGVFDLQQGRYADAVPRFQQALSLCRAEDDQFGEARALGELGVIHRRRGQFPEAADHQQRALALFRAVGDQTQEAMTLTRLATVESQRGRCDQAAEHGRRALALFRATGNRFCEAYALTRLGAVEENQGHHHSAGDHQRQALALFRQLGDHIGEAEALDGLAGVLHATGRTEHARVHYTALLELAVRTGNLHQQARAHDGLAGLVPTTDHDDQVRHHLWRAFTLYTNLGAPEADRIRAQLTMTDDQA